MTDAASHAGPSTGPGTIALVTGASSGIGAATARLLAAGGTTVALVARRADRLEAVAEDCRLTAPRSRAWVADLEDTEQAGELALQIWDDLGPLDVVVNNAAVPMRRPAQRLTMAEVVRTMTVNFYSPVAITLALLPRMLERGSGTIVNVSSMGGRLGIASEAAYSASKFALAGWSESLAVDLLGTGLSVKLILPGAFDTEIWDQPGNDTAPYSGPLAPPEEGAVGVVESIGSDRFEHYVPDMKAVVEMKTRDIEGFMKAMRAMADADGAMADADGGGKTADADGGGKTADADGGGKAGDPA
jgi:short-subunit dehydrogenase